MACVEDIDRELKHKAQISMAHATDAFSQIQAQMLTRGAASFKTFQRRFRIMDDDRSNKLNLEEFTTGMRDIGVKVSASSLREAFNQFDKDGSGSIDMTEFVTALRPKMNRARTNIVNQCFILMDKTGDGEITVEDLVGSYKVNHHKKFLSGEWTERRVYEEFLKSFEAEAHVDGKVTLDEFMSYYSCLSASIDTDPYFRLMMQNSWKHLDKSGTL